MISRLRPPHTTGDELARSLALALARYWLPLAAVMTMLAGLAYLMVQQDLRQGANDPQVQMAEDAAAALGRGQAIDAVLGSGQVDMAASLAPYLIVFDASGRPLAASVRLDGAIPDLPRGVADFMASHNEDRISWQPRSGVRSAAVLRRISGPAGGFVLAGRSLREIEDRESYMVQVSLAVWLLGVAGLLVLVLAGWYLAAWWQPSPSATASG